MATDFVCILPNLFLTNKQSSLTPDIINRNAIWHVIAILSHTEDYLKLSTAIPNVSFTVIEYGNKPALQTAEFYRISRMILDPDKNTLVFHNGCMQSMPFLVYYLMQFHGVLSIQQAVDNILAQITKTYCNVLRHIMIDSMKHIFQNSASDICKYPSLLRYGRNFILDDTI